MTLSTSPMGWCWCWCLCLMFSFTEQQSDLGHMILAHQSVVVIGPLALIDSAFHRVLVHRLADLLNALSPRSVALASCASLRSLWPAHRRILTSKSAPILGAAITKCPQSRALRSSCMQLTMQHLLTAFGGNVLRQDRAICTAFGRSRSVAVPIQLADQGNTACKRRSSIPRCQNKSIRRGRYTT